MCRLLQNSRVLIIVFFALVLVACGEERIDPNAVPPVGTRPADLEYQLQQIDHLFVLQHYEQQRMEGPYQALGWLNDEFNAISVTEMDYRSVHQVPGMEDNTFYRFTLIIESFWTPAQAGQRLARLFERPPDLHVEQGKAFPLRRGFAIGRNVYTLATDVNAFSPELERLTKELEPQFREKVRFDPLSSQPNFLAERSGISIPFNCWLQNGPPCLLPIPPDSHAAKMLLLRSCRL